jgi:hypothetical protein
MDGPVGPSIFLLVLFAGCDTGSIELSHMVEIEIEVQNPAECDVGAAVEATVSAMGLNITMDGTLKSFPGSRHWHLQKPRRTGTLELTWWPSTHRLWVSYHENRVGDGWVKALAAELAQAIASTLNSPDFTA